MSVREFFSAKRGCKPLIKYQARAFSFDASITEGVVDLSNIKTNVETIEQAGEITKIWSDYQKSLCELYKDIDSSDPEFKIYRRKMVSALKKITFFRLALTYFKRNPNKGISRLEKAMDVLQEFLLDDEEMEETNTVELKDLSQQELLKLKKLGGQ